MRIVGGHGGDRWKVRANAKGSGSWLLLRFLRRSKIEQLFTCTATNFLSLPLPSTLRASSHFSCRNWSNVLNAELQELANRILPICEHYMVVSQFVESRSHFKHGLTNHAFASGLRAILQVKMSLSFIGGVWWQLFPFVCDVWSRLPQFEHDEAHRMSWLLCRQDYHAMVAQLEHQFRLQRLSLPGLWFFVQVTYLSASSQANNKTRFWRYPFVAKDNQSNHATDLYIYFLIHPANDRSDAMSFHSTANSVDTECLWCCFIELAPQSGDT